MSMMGENDNGGIGSFDATSIEPDEGNEPGEERHQRALAMLMDENDNNEIGGTGPPLECAFPLFFFLLFLFFWCAFLFGEN